MQAKVMPKIEDRKRVPLQEVLPLDCPFSVQIDVADVCNMRCNFCFHSDMHAIKKFNVHFGIMEMSVFQKIIDDMKASWGGNVKKLRLFALGEPLLNPQLLEMAKYAKKAEVAEIIELTTNGVLINEKFWEGIADSGIGIINLSINGLDADQYEKNCGIKINWENFVHSIRMLYDYRGACRIFIKFSDIGYSEAEKEKVYKTFGDICDQIFVETVSDSLWQDTRVSEVIHGSEKGIYGQPIKRKQVCTAIFTTMVINSSGEAKLCCSDWKNEFIIGDTRSQTMDQIWKGEKLRNFQRAFLDGKRDSMPFCRSCVSPEISTPDNVDDYMDELKIKFEKL